MDAQLYPYVTPTDRVYGIPALNKQPWLRVLPVGAYSGWSDVAEAGAAARPGFPTTFKETGGVGDDIRCRYDQDCPAGTWCKDGKCVREWCSSDGASSSGICNNTPDFQPPYTSSLQQCQFDSQCPTGNCLNGPRYAPDPENGMYYCGRKPVDSQYTRYSRISPMYGPMYGWRTLRDGPLYLQNRPS